ncbi:MAG: dihydrofolate reductase family protein [Acidimicrobiales bacterium]
MRKLIWMMSMSVDGYMEGPNREIDWHMVDDEFFRHMVDWLGHAGGFLEGRVTYQLMAEFWPTADQDPAATPDFVEFARIWRDVPKVVYSRTLKRADWNATVVHDVVPAEVLALKAAPGGDLVLGGSDLGAEFARHDLIDEYRLYVHPIVIGRGTPMLRPSDAKVALRLIETHTFGNGVVMLRYERRPSAALGQPTAEENT